MNYALSPLSMIYGQWCIVYGHCIMVYSYVLWFTFYVLWSMWFGLCYMVYCLCAMFFVLLPMCSDHCSMVFGLWSMIIVLWYMFYGLCSMVYVLWSMACMFDVLEFGLFDVLIDLYSSSDIPARGAPKTFLQKFHKMRFSPKNEYYLWWHFRINAPWNSLRKYETNVFISTLISLISLECLSKLSTALQPYLYIWYSIHILLS